MLEVIKAFMFIFMRSLTVWLFKDLHKYVYAYENVQGFP